MKNVLLPFYAALLAVLLWAACEYSRYVARENTKQVGGVTVTWSIIEENGNSPAIRYAVFSEKLLDWSDVSAEGDTIVLTAIAEGPEDPTKIKLQKGQQVWLDPNGQFKTLEKGLTIEQFEKIRAGQFPKTDKKVGTIEELRALLSENP